MTHPFFTVTTGLEHSKSFLNQQILYALSYFGLHLGKYALVADCCRIILSQYEQQFNKGKQFDHPFGCDIQRVWIIRGFAFAGMGQFQALTWSMFCLYIGIGCVHLSHLHFKSVANDPTVSNPTNFDDCYKHLETAQVSHVQWKVHAQANVRQFHDRESMY